VTPVLPAPLPGAALAFLLLAGLAEPLIEYALGRLADDEPVCAWCWEHVLAPALRAAVVAGFVLLAYPALFGLREAPSLAALLAAGEARVDTLVGTLFALSLLLPLAGFVARRSSLLVPLQGIIAVALVFDWYTGYLGAGALGPWPGTGQAAVVAVAAASGHLLARFFARLAGRQLDALWELQGIEHLLHNGAALLAQAPAILLYGLALGRQLAV